MRIVGRARWLLLFVFLLGAAVLGWQHGRGVVRKPVPAEPANQAPPALEEPAAAPSKPPKGPISCESAGYISEESIEICRLTARADPEQAIEILIIGLNVGCKARRVYSRRLGEKHWDDSGFRVEELELEDKNEVTNIVDHPQIEWEEDDVPTSAETCFAELKDVNFDGILDFQIKGGRVTGCGSGGCVYHFILYDPETGKLVARPDLDLRLRGYVMNFYPESKTIDSYTKASCCHLFKEIYRWIDKKFVKVHDEEQIFDGWLSSEREDVEVLVGLHPEIQQFCILTVREFNNSGLLVQTKIQINDGDEYCPAYRTKSRSKRSGTFKNKNITDVYSEGRIMSRTIDYDPPKRVAE